MIIGSPPAISSMCFPCGRGFPHRNRSQGDRPNFRGTKGVLAQSSTVSAAKMGLSPSHRAEKTARAAP